MTTRERRIDRGRRRVRHGLATIGEEFHVARRSAGLTQRHIASLVGISDSEYSRIERGESSKAPYLTLAIVAAVLGFDLPLRAFPIASPIRDRAQLELLSSFRSLLPPELAWRSEVPLPISGDLRAWDAEVGGEDWRIAVDAESRLGDIQALVRREALKRRDAGIKVMILVVADTRHNRDVLRLHRADLSADFPLSGKEVLAALGNRRSPNGSGIVVVKSRFPPGERKRPT